MREHDDDRGLREAFQALRRRDREALPPFGVPTRRPNQLRVIGHLARAAALVAVAIGLWRVTTGGGPDRERYPIDLARTTWESPTDFLLETPGIAFLQTVPGVGWTRDLVAPAAPQPTPSVPAERQRRIPS